MEGIEVLNARLKTGITGWSPAMSTRGIFARKKNPSVLTTWAHMAEREGRRGLAGCFWAEAVRARAEEKGRGWWAGPTRLVRLRPFYFFLNQNFSLFFKNKTKTTFV